MSIINLLVWALLREKHFNCVIFVLCFEGDSMMYHNSANTNGNCSGGGTGSSPNSTPPNINATTPPLSSQTSQGDGKFNDELVNLQFILLFGNFF